MCAQQSAPRVAGTPSVASPWDSARWKLHTVGKDVELPERTPKKVPEKVEAKKKKTVYDRLYKEFYDREIKHWDRVQKKEEKEMEEVEKRLKKKGKDFLLYGKEPEPPEDKTKTEAGVLDSPSGGIQKSKTQEEEEHFFDWTSRQAHIDEQINHWIDMRNRNEHMSQKRIRQPFKEGEAPSPQRFIAANAPMPMKGEYPFIPRPRSSTHKEDAHHHEEEPLTPPTLSRTGVEIKTGWSKSIPSPGAYVLESPPKGPPPPRRDPKITKARMIRKPPNTSRPVVGILDPRLRHPEEGACFVRIEDGVGLKPALTM